MKGNCNEQWFNCSKKFIVILLTGDGMWMWWLLVVGVLLISVEQSVGFPEQGKWVGVINQVYNVQVGYL